MPRRLAAGLVAAAAADSVEGSAAGSVVAAAADSARLAAVLFRTAAGSMAAA